MTEDRSKGIDGHNPRDERRNKLEKQILEQYGKETIEELPINIYGILLQADEEYGNKIWDKHFGRIYDILKQQKRNYQFSGLINPFASIQSLSMASCGTDLIHHLDFLHQDCFSSFFENIFLLIQIHPLEFLIFFDILSNNAFKYFVCPSSIKKFEALKYSFIIIFEEILGLYKNSNIALLTITWKTLSNFFKSKSVLR